MTTSTLSQLASLLRAERGNCIAASIPLALTEAVNGGQIQRGDQILLLGSGAGLALGAISLIF